MSTDSAIFTLPRDVSVIAAARALARETHAHGAVRVHAAPRECAQREWLDSFDWRLHRAGLRLEWQRGAHGSWLRLWCGDRLAAPAEFAATQRPRLLADLPAGSLRRRLARVLEVRALLAQATHRGVLERLDLLDARDKVIVRVELWRQPRARTRLARVLAVRGFESAARGAARCLGALGNGAAPDPLCTGAQHAPVPPGGYPSWTGIALHGEMRTDDGVQQVLRHYAAIMTLNIDGAREHVDPEFLHDFRVGLRRSRALLRRLPGVFPAAQLRPHLEALAWLGRETTLTRDADVHALVLPDYAAALPEPAQAAALAPLWARVQDERRAAHERLTALLALYDVAAREQPPGADSDAAMQRLLAELGLRSMAARARFAAGFEAFLAVRLERAVRAHTP